MFYHRLHPFTSILILAFVICEVTGTLKVKPRNTTVVTGDSTFFNCSTTMEANNNSQFRWILFKGSELDEGVIYTLNKGAVYEDYKLRFSVEGNPAEGSYNLVISNVTKEDAGRYECHDRDKATAQLIVLDSKPICRSSMNPDGVIGPNDCNLDPEDIYLSCGVAYTGKIPPKLRWVKRESETPITDALSCPNSSNSVNCTLKIPSDVSLQGSSYVCQTEEAVDVQYDCSVDPIKVLYVENNFRLTSVSYSETITCSAKSSQWCEYKWEWCDGPNNISATPLSDSAVLETNHHGIHRCEAECKLRGKTCTVTAMLVKVEPSQGSSNIPNGVAAESTSENMSGMRTGIILLALLLGLLIALNVIYIGIRTSKRRRRYQACAASEPIPLTQLVGNLELQRELDALIRRDKDFRDLLSAKDPKELKLGVRKTKDSKNNRLPCGLAMLKDKLYVIFDGMSDIEIYNLNTLAFIREFKVDDLRDPGDIKSCHDSERLFIIDWKGSDIEDEILILDLNDQVKKRWNIVDDECRLSVRVENTLVVACYKRHEIVEYTADGNGEWTPKIVSVGKSAQFPWHAVKLSSSFFVVCHGKMGKPDDPQDSGVCIIDDKGEALRSFAGIKEVGRNPACLDIRSDGSIIVAYQRAIGICHLNSVLELKSKMSSNDHGFRILRNFALDNRNERLLLVECDEKILADGKPQWYDGKILAFNIKRSDND